jgi:class 3 adenylate cyclase
MDAAGSERAVIYGISEGGPMAILFAARYPERVHSLILYGTAARFTADDDYPFGFTTSDMNSLLDLLSESWGEGVCYGLFVQNPPDPELARRALAPFERAACTPRMAREIMERNAEIDVRPLLGSVCVPTLVIHCAGDPTVPVGLGRYLGEHIPGARYVELPGRFHGSWRPEDFSLAAGPIAEFLGELGAGAPPAPPTDRVLATVVFTDIVGSTQRVSGAGDRAWRELLDRHDDVAADKVSQHGGRLIKTTGDGALATFGGPSAGLDAARSIRDAVAGLGIEIRAGVHTGEVELRDGDVSGIAVHIAARISELAAPGRIWVSRTVKDLVTGSGATFEDRDEHELKGVVDRWRLYELCS